MGYKVIISQRAQQEIENAIDYYALYSSDAPKRFVTLIAKAYILLETNPKLKFSHANVRKLHFKKFPYSLFFTVNEETKTVQILSCFHNKRNPKNMPRY